MDNLTKQCSKCKCDLPLDAYSKDKSKKYGVAGTCKKCVKEYQTEFYRTKEGLIKKLYMSQKASSKKRGMAMPTYTLEWLTSHLISNPEFHRLYDIWVISGYKKYLSPSIDRIDDNVSYTEYNIQLMSWMENDNKYKADSKNNKKNKAVLQYDKDGMFIKEWFSVEEASRNTKAGQSEISKCCRGKLKTSGGFIWKFKKESEVS